MKDNMLEETLSLIDKKMGMYPDPKTPDQYYYVDSLKEIRKHLTAELDLLKEKMQFRLNLISKDSRLEVIDEMPFSMHELYNIAFVQPLFPLCEEDMSNLHEAIISSVSKGAKGKHIILIPYDIKLIKVNAIITD